MLINLNLNSHIIVQLLSHVQFFVTPWTAACQAFLSFTVSRSLLKLMSIESVIPSNHLFLCCLLLLLPSIFPSIRVFSSESSLHIRWPKDWSFSFSISPSMNIQDWFPLDELVGSPCSPRRLLLQHHNSKASILQCSFCSTLTSIYDYCKTIALTRWTFTGKVMSLLCNMLYRFVIAFLPSSKHHLISRLQSPSAVILESCHC